MKRKGLLLSGVFLSITYSLLLVCTIFVTAATTIFHFVASQSETVKEMFYGFLKPILTLGETKKFIILGIAIAFAIFMTIVCKKFIKYATVTNEKFTAKRNFLIFNTICVALCTAGIIYLLVWLITKKQFSANAISICTILETIVHTASLITIIVYICKEPNYDYSQNNALTNLIVAMPSAEAATKALPKNTLPKIYTDGYEEQEKAEEETTTKQTKQESKNIESSKYGNQLIEAIMRLDNLRKEGKISAVEYTKLRGKLVRKYTK